MKKGEYVSPDMEFIFVSKTSVLLASIGSGTKNLDNGDWGAQDVFE